MGYSGAGGKLIHEKNQKQKISWHCPFKLALALPLGIQVSATERRDYTVFLLYTVQ